MTEANHLQRNRAVETLLARPINDALPAATVRGEVIERCQLTVAGRGCRQDIPFSNMYASRRLRSESAGSPFPQIPTDRCPHLGNTQM